MEASIRNVLGDIGNRIGLGAKNEQVLSAKPNDVLLKHQPQQQQQQLRITKTSTTTTTTTTKIGQTMVVQQQQKQQTSSLSVKSQSQPLPQSTQDHMLVQEETACGMDTNNSCIMLDESEQTNSDDIEIDETETETEEEVDEEEENDEEDEEEDDEEIMYSDDDDEEIETAGAAATANDNQIIDIDAIDADDPQLCTTYVREIYAYLTQLERKYRISPNFLEKKSVTARMRSVLIDWLIQVHLKFQLLQETMYLTVHLIDAYLERCDVSKMQLQLVGVTAMFLASKYEEMYVPAIDDFVYMTDNTYTKSEIRKMEVNMCKTLDFGFGKPFPLHFLRRFSKASQADPKQHTLAKYFMELSLHDADFATMDPSMLAACSLNLAFQLLNGPSWNKNLEHYSGYKESDLEEGMAKLANLTLKAMDLNYKYRAATNKYGISKFMRIALLPELSSKYMRDLAAKAPATHH